MHRLVLTSLRVLQYQLQLPIYIYIYIYTHTVTCKIGRSTNPAKFAHKLEKAQTNTNTQPMHQPTKICALPLVDQQFFKPAISTHQILSKTFFREGDPSPAAYCRKLSYFCQVKLFYTKKRKPPARAARGCYQIKAF